MFPYTTSYEEYIVQHHIPMAPPYGMGMPVYSRPPVPGYYAPPYGPQFGNPAYGFGGVQPYMPMMGGMMAAGMTPMLGMGYGYRDAFGVQRGDWAGPYNGGTEGNIPN
jgi:hypothetical protein